MRIFNGTMNGKQMQTISKQMEQGKKSLFLLKSQLWVVNCLILLRLPGHLQSNSAAISLNNC